jgi:hypothetical protein
MSRIYSASIEIEAPAPVVWSVLTDFARYPEWNPFTIEVRTHLCVGDPVDMRVRMMRLGVTIDQREHVREVVEGERIRWGMRAGRIVRGERTQKVEALAEGRARYVTEDEISGVCTPLVHAIFGGSLELGFTSMAKALARECERRNALAR